MSDIVEEKIRRILEANNIQVDVENLDDVAQDISSRLRFTKKDISKIIKNRLF